MKPGHESRTAILVCMARAAAHGRTPVTEFQDPTAITLLPEDARVRVERLRNGVPAEGFRENMDRKIMARRSAMMVARTVAIDEAVRGASSPQVVILGAGLDGRAWRMRELERVTVFEVDHPDSQRQKRARVDAFERPTREVRFVPVDFTRDALDDALASAGHDPTRPTTWIWEGVVMYLERSDIEATLRVVAARSAKGSRIIIAYLRPSLILPLVALLVRLVGEPFRSLFTAEQMRTLLERHGFNVEADESLDAIGAKLSPELRRDTRVMKHQGIAIAVRR